jgi:hypothetical protein
VQPHEAAPLGDIHLVLIQWNQLAMAKPKQRQGQKAAMYSMGSPKGSQLLLREGAPSGESICQIASVTRLRALVCGQAGGGRGVRGKAGTAGGG